MHDHCARHVSISCCDPIYFGVQAEKKRDGNSRARVTEIVNNMFVRKGEGKQAKLELAVQSNPFFEEIISKHHEKYKDEYEKGCLCVASM